MTIRRTGIAITTLVTVLMAAPTPSIASSSPEADAEERAQEIIELLLWSGQSGADRLPTDECAPPPPTPEPLGKFHGECQIEGMSELARKNCQMVLENGLVPRNAFLFAMKGLQKNATQFKSRACFDQKAGFEDVFGHYSTPGLESQGDLEAALETGIPNKCSLIINNYDELLRTHDGSYRCQATMYYIDLCGLLPEVHKSYSWVGYGTCKNKRGFKNQSGQGTSLLGFSVTGTQSFNFQKSDSAYNAIRRSLGGKVPAVALFGLQNSNNGSAVDYKYLHVGAYTSAGCPSIDKKNAWMIEKLAEQGPSVVVGYREGQMEDLDECDATSAEETP
jgi:hypothetical protein